MSQQTTIDAFSNNSLVVTLDASEIETVEKVIRSCYAAGIDIFEFSARVSNSHELIITVLERLRDLTGWVVGVSMVMNERDADGYIQAGVSYISSPCFIDSVSDTCYQNKIPYVPGCMTIREVYKAVQAGCEIVQIFPAEVTGVSFATTVKTVFPEVKLLVSGLVLQPKYTFENWFAAGASAVTIGSSIVKNEWINNGEYDQLENEIRKLLEKLRQ